MPLLSYALCTLAEVKTFLGITNNAQDDLLELLINQATDYIEGITNRRFASTVYTNEEYDGTGGSQLRLYHHPIISFTSLQKNNATDHSDDWVTVDTADYWVDNENGIVTITSSFYDYDDDSETGLSPNTFTSGKNKYRATYTAGYATVPYNIKYAAMMFISETLNFKKATGIKSESLGDHSITFESIYQSNKVIKDVLSGYKDYEI